jgi:tetratricopeptide (TPR) repeat protein
MDQKTHTDEQARERARQLLNRGADLLQRGQAREAIPLLEQARRLDPDSVAAHINLGGAYVMAGRHKEAIPLLETARDAEPDNTMIWINLGAAYLGNPILATSEQQMQAITAFERALELDSSAPSVHYNLGLIFVDRDDIDLALAAFRQAMRVNPLDRDAQSWLNKLEAAGSRGGDSE